MTRSGLTKGIRVALPVLLLAATLGAQMRTGNIYGKITDEAGNVLPGVTVTLQGPQIGSLTTISNEAGIYRFVSISPGTQYEITAEMPGFKKATWTGIVVRTGLNSEINLRMEIGGLEEEIRVSAQPPLIDTKTTAVGANIDKKAIQSLPTARDPWVMVQLAPSIMVGQENVGGNKSGQQSALITRGDTSMARISNNQGANNIWAIDGVDITDPVDLGSSALYYDFDMFEEMQIQTGGATDISIQTGGIVLNMVTRRGGNRTSLAGRIYLTDNFFQANNLTDDLRDQGVTNVNKIQQIRDFGFNAGGPILKDKVWWWGAYSVQDIFVYTITGNEDRTLLNNYSLKLNAQLLPNNRFEALFISAAKEKFGWNSSFEKPEGDHLQGNYHWGNPIMKLQDEHVFGNYFHLSLKFSYNDAGFGWRPMTDPKAEHPIVYSHTQGKYVPYTSGMRASWGSYGVSRPRRNYQIQGIYFNDVFLGLSQEIKFGIEYSEKVQRTAPDTSGNIQGFDITRDYNSPALDVDADGIRTTAEMSGWQRVVTYRRDGSNSFTNHCGLYFQDTIVRGNFTLSLGLRFDKQWPGNGAYVRDAIITGTPAWDAVFSPEVSSILEDYMPDRQVDPCRGNMQIVAGMDQSYQWNTLSPRIGLTWDIGGDGRTVAKLAASEYGDIMGVGQYAFTLFGTGGGIRLWWNDDGDELMEIPEVYWAWSSRNPVADPTNPGLPYQYVPYRLWDDEGNLSAEAAAAIIGGYDSDSYSYGNYYGYDLLNPCCPPDYSLGIPTYFLNRAAQSSSRIREILMAVEREILPDFSASINFTYRKYDRNQITLVYYPPEHTDEYPTYDGPEIIDPRTAPPGGWYVQAGTVPDAYIIGGSWTFDPDLDQYVNVGGTTYSSGDAAGRPYYLPGPDWPTTPTRYRLIRKSDNYFNYYAVDLVLNKRLSNKWFMNGSFTWQTQTAHWGTDFFDPTNQWCNDGKPYGDWDAGSDGRTSALMHTRWMAKLSGMYQLPYGFDISATFNAREGWKIPQYFTLDLYDAPNYDAGHAVTIYKQNNVVDSLPMFCNITLRVEKKISLGQTGRLYLMADIFNLLNSNMAIRSYPKDDGTAYYRVHNGVLQEYDSSANPYNGVLSEILNPRIWRFGVRFEF